MYRGQKSLICGEMLLADLKVIGWFPPAAAPNPPTRARSLKKWCRALLNYPRRQRVGNITLPSQVREENRLLPRTISVPQS